jgi:dipeptidyl aminopeptidase/acylaminoacyl peptidase
MMSFARCMLVALAAPLVAAAQRSPAPERATFYLLLNNDTLGIERTVRTEQRVEGDFLDKLHGVRVRYALTLAPDATSPAAETWLYRAGGDTSSAQHASLRLVGDTMLVEVAGAPEAQRIATRAGALTYVNPSAVILEQALRRARVLGGTSAQVPLFQAAGGQTAPLDITWIGSDSATLSLGGVVMRAAVSSDGKLLGFVVPSQNFRAVRVEGTRAASMTPTDYTAPKGAPYTAREVTIRTPAGITLAGTLTMPIMSAGHRAPAVVTITGSGTQERDEALLGVTGYRPFRELADTLARRGIAVLRLDDRGAGGSEAGPPGATSADFADDVRAALEFLRTQAEIAGDRLGIVGHSEGGLIAPMVAATDPRLRGIVLMAGPSRSGRSILEYQQRYAIDSMMKLTGQRRDSAMMATGKTLDSVAAVQPWLRFFADYDPLPTARRVRTPVLVLQGATDRQVTADQAQELVTAFRAAGNRDVTVKIFPATNHLFLADPNGNPSGYASIPSKRVRPEVLGTIADWLSAKLK